MNNNHNLRKIRRDMLLYTGASLLLVAVIMFIIYGFHGDGFHIAARIIAVAALVFGLILIRARKYVK